MVAPRGKFPAWRVATDEGGRAGGWQWRRRWCGGQAQQRATCAMSTDPQRDADRVSSPGVGGVPEQLFAHGVHSYLGLTEELGGMDNHSRATILHPRTDVDRVHGNIYHQLPCTGNRSSKTGTCAAPRCPVRELICTRREGSPNAACRNLVTTSSGGRESSYALVEHMHTLASGHSHRRPVHHGRRF